MVNDVLISFSTVQIYDTTYVHLYMNNLLSLFFTTKFSSMCQLKDYIELFFCGKN